MKKSETNYTRILQEQGSDGEDALLPHIPEAVTEVQGFIQDFRINQLREFRFSGEI